MQKVELRSDLQKFQLWSDLQKFELRSDLQKVELRSDLQKATDLIKCSTDGPQVHQRCKKFNFFIQNGNFYTYAEPLENLTL